MEIKLKPTDDVIVEVTPRSAGNYGIFSVSGQHRSPEDEYSLAKDIEDDIKRHVGDVQYTNINQRMVYEDEEGNEYETLFELLDVNLDSAVIPYRYRYERPTDSGVGTTGHTYNFKELVETAFNYPYKFTVISENLTNDQQEFINKVVEVGLESSIKWI